MFYSDKQIGKIPLNIFLLLWVPFGLLHKSNPKYFYNLYCNPF